MQSLMETLNQHTQSPDLRTAFIQALLPTLVRTPVLQQLSHLQRTLDPLDIEGLRKLHEHSNQGNKFDSNLKLFENLPPEPNLATWKEFVEQYKKYYPEASTVNDNRRRELQTSLDSAKLHYYTLSYLLSATVKDCSIMIRPPFPPSSLDSPPDGSKRGENPGSVTIIDLDPKSIKRLTKWAKLDRKIVSSFKDDGLLACIDALASRYVYGREHNEGE